jgi:transaldolase
MKLFLDSADEALIDSFLNKGIVRGVTTNPTILAQQYGGMSKAQVLGKVTHLAKSISPLPFSVETFARSRNEIIDDCVTLSDCGDNVVVKITPHGTQMDEDFLAEISELSRRQVSLNVTALMSAQQAFLAALAGAKYVSIFGGRVSDMGHDVVDEIGRARAMVDSVDSGCEIIMGSVRCVGNIQNWLLSGAHIVTVPPSLLNKMIFHPYTALTAQQFFNDAEKFA